MARVCLFMADFSGGGAERVMMNIGAGLAGRGHEVDLLVARADGPYCAAVPGSVTVRSLGRRLVQSTLPLASYIHQSRPGCILTAGEHPSTIAVLARSLGRRRPHLVVSLHNAIQLKSEAPSTKLKERISPLLVKLFYPAADRIVAVSEDLRQEAMCLIGGRASRYRTIYNPIFSPDLPVRGRERAAHRWLDAPDLPVILAAGRLTRQKGFDTLLRAFAWARREKPAHLIILGEGPDRGDLTALADSLGIHHDVDFPGFVGNPYAFMSRAALLVMSSRWEGFGNVLVEAMAVGTPVVSTNCPYGPREILAGGKYGPLVPIDRPRVMAEAIVQTLAKPVAKSQLVERAAFFSIERALDLYEEVLDLAGPEKRTSSFPSAEPQLARTF